MPGAKASNLVIPHIDELEGTGQREVRDAWGNARESMVVRLA